MTGKTYGVSLTQAAIDALQWSPVFVTGKTNPPVFHPPYGAWLQWSPVFVTGKTEFSPSASREGA